MLFKFEREQLKRALPLLKSKIDIMEDDILKQKVMDLEYGFFIGNYPTLEVEKKVLEQIQFAVKQNFEYIYADYEEARIIKEVL